MSSPIRSGIVVPYVPPVVPGPILPPDLPTFGVRPSDGHLLAWRRAGNIWSLGNIDLDDLAEAAENALLDSLMLMGG